MLNSEKMIASLDQQDLAHAEKYFQKALKEDDADSLIALGEYLESIGFLPHAKRIYLQLADDYPELNINLAQIAAEDDAIEEAFLYLDKVSKDSPNYLSALLVMADLYDMEGLTEVAREKLLQAVSISPEPLVIFGLAEIDMSLQYFKEAIDYYAQLDNRQILELTGISTYQRIGRAYASLGKFEAAIEFLEKAPWPLNTKMKLFLNWRPSCMTKKIIKKLIFTLNSWKPSIQIIQVMNMVML